MMGVKQDACLNCHAEELKAANDTHPAKKFNDPTNADRLAILDAQTCTTCHREHVPDQTHPMGLSLPTDYCFHCHQDIFEQRPSHASFTYDSCATAGCHNYHDNRALYENFLAQHAGQPDVLETAVLRPLKDDPSERKALSRGEMDAPSNLDVNDEVIEDWAATTHAAAGVNCSACHLNSDRKWNDHVSHETCGNCHEFAVDGFLAGRHGMRLAQDMEPLEPQDARLPMKSSAAHQQLTCNSCHPGHRFDTRFAAVDACLQCHDDAHSNAYLESSHYRTWLEESEGIAAAGTGVSCATCHLPRTHTDDGRTLVQHNQNDNLRPNEKMIRSVCMNCHGVEFSLNSLADRALIDQCFNGQPSISIDSVKMAVEWFEQRKKKRQRTSAN